MELRDLRCFVTVAEELSFSRAAQRLHITQPPLSVRVKHLEEELGVTLLERSTRNVRLTEAGQLLLEEARQLFRQLEENTRMVRRVGRGEVGRLTLGFVASAANGPLPPLLRAFRERFLDVELSLYEMNPRQSVDALQDKRIDAAFFYLPFGDVPPFEDPTLGYRPVSCEPLFVALPDGHPLAGQRQIELQSLADEPFILVPRYQRAGLHDTVVELCRQAGFVPKVVQETYLVQTSVGLVASGIGITLVPASLRNLQTTGVVYRSVQGSTPTVQLGVVWRRDDPGVILNSFLRVVTEVLRDDQAIGEGKAVPPPSGAKRFAR
jgi:DNA-binding transcriptional LysR family regulator